MKNMNTLLGMFLCLSIVSFAPKSLIDNGRTPASTTEEVPNTVTVRVEAAKESLFVFGPLVIYKRAQRIEEVRVHYQRLQSDVDTIAAQRAEIERLLNRNGIAMSEVNRLKKDLKKVTASHAQTKAQLEQIKNDFETERNELQAEIDALIASNEATEAQKLEALSMLEAERTLARNLALDMDQLKTQLDESRAQLSDVKTQLEEAQAEIVAKEEELQRIKCENEDALATLKKDIKKIQTERDELTRSIVTLQEEYEADLANQQMQNQMMMMAMAQFSYQAMLSPQHNPYLRPSSLFDPNYQMMHMQQAELITQMTRQKYMPQITNNYYGDHSFAYGSGHDFMNKNLLHNDHYSMFAENTDLNSSRMPSSVQPTLAPGYFVF